jgi:SPP1 family predicted phage head-tail adaptor
MSMGAGEFNRKILLRERTGAVDGTNQPLDEWNVLPTFTLWAKILGANGMAVVRSALAGVPAAPGKYSFRVRYRPTGITEDMRVEYGGTHFVIRDIRHDLDRHEWTDIICETGVTNV